MKHWAALTEEYKRDETAAKLREAKAQQAAAIAAARGRGR